MNMSQAGVVFFTGALNAPAFNVVSDERLKHNIQPMGDTLEAVTKLETVTFDWKREQYPDRRLPEKGSTGFIAQQMRDVLPDVVEEAEDGFLSINFTKLTPVLARAVKELHDKLTKTEQRLAQLEQR